MKKYDLKELKRKVKYYKDIPINEINSDDVIDIKDIKIDRRKPSDERLLDFLNVVENPYVFKIKGRIVKVNFSDSDKTAEDCLTSVLKSLYK